MFYSLHRHFLFTIVLLLLTAISAITGIVSLGNYRYFQVSSQNSYQHPVQDVSDRLLTLARTAAPYLRVIKAKGLQNLKENTSSWGQHLREGQGLEWFDANGEHLLSEGNTFPEVPLAKVFFSLRLNNEVPVIEQHGDVRSVSIAVYTNQPDQQKKQLEGYVRASELIHPSVWEANPAQRISSIVLFTILFAVSTVSLFLFIVQPLKKNFQQLKHFNTNVAHELRNSLTAINIAAEVMQSQSHQFSPQVAKKLATIISCTEQLTRLVDDLAMLSKLDEIEKSSRIHHAVIPLDELLEDVVEQFESQAEMKKIHFEFHLPAGIFVVGDFHQLSRLFSNLLENAFKYTAAGGRIALMLRREKRFAVVHVEDTGIGIPQESIPYIFERFWRSEGAKARQKDGLGLGLAIAKSIVDRHNGQIKVKSRVGVGSSFQVYLPLAGTRLA